MNCNGARPMSIRLLASFAMLFLALAGWVQPAQAVPPLITAANPVVIDFDALVCDELVQTFYAGGTGSKGSGPGPDYGVTFTAPARVRTDASPCH